MPAATVSGLILAEMVDATLLEGDASALAAPLLLLAATAKALAIAAFGVAVVLDREAR